MMVRWCIRQTHLTQEQGQHMYHPGQKNWHSRACQTIVHSKKTEPWGVFDFFQMFWKIFQFSLFQCLKDAFVLLKFQFQVYSTLGKQLSFFRAKISGFAFSPTSKRSLQVCVVHIPFPRAARKGQSPMNLHCNYTGAMQRGRQQKPRYVLVQKRIPELFFFVKADVLFWKRSSFVYLEESVRVPSFVDPFPASSPLSIVRIDVSEISKPPTRLPHREKWQPWSLKMLSNKKEVLWAATHSGVQTAAAGNSTQYPNF